MTDKPKESAPSLKSAPKRPALLGDYIPGDPIPAPEAVEANSDSAWALFSDLHRAPENDFPDTVPMSAADEQSISDTPKKPA